MTVTTSSFPYNGFIFKIIHLFLTSGLISVSILAPQISTQTHCMAVLLLKTVPEELAEKLSEVVLFEN